MRVVIFLWQPDDTVVRELGAFDAAIAADSGLHSATRWGVNPDIVVGDFDSIDESELDKYTDVRRYPTTKDATDFELAVDVALQLGATSITVVCSSLGRADHALAVMLGLGAPQLLDISVDAYIDGSYAQVVRTQAHFSAANGKTLSLIPLHGDATGVTTQGLRYPLTGAILQSGSSLPISNEIVDENAAVSLTSGVLLALHS